MDLEPIEERANEFATWVGKFDSTQRIPAAFASAADVSALLAEVKRLTAEVQERDEWLHETAALLPEGFDGDEWEGEVIARFIRQAARRDPEPMPVTMIAALTRAVAKTEARLATPKETDR